MNRTVSQVQDRRPPRARARAATAAHAASYAAARSPPSACEVLEPARGSRPRATQPGGVRDADARGRCPRTRTAAAARCPGARSTPAAFSAPGAVEWFADASPKLQTATASSRPRRQRRRAGAPGRCANATPTRAAGGTRSSTSAGSPRAVMAEHLVPATGDRLGCRGDEPEQHVLTGSCPGRLLAPGRRRTRPSGSAAGPDRSAASAAATAALPSWPADPIV